MLERKKLQMQFLGTRQGPVGAYEAGDTAEMPMAVREKLSNKP